MAIKLEIIRFDLKSRLYVLIGRFSIGSRLSYILQIRFKIGNLCFLGDTLFLYFSVDAIKMNCARSESCCNHANDVLGV